MRKFGISIALVFIISSIFCGLAFAQSGVVSARLVDAATGDALGYATASLTQKNAKDVYKYILSDDEGKLSFTGVKGGSFIFKAELMGYKTYSKEIVVKGKIDLGEIKMEEDKQVLEAASVSAVGNPVVVKKDTIEYSATSFKTTEDDALVDLLKKLPGVEVNTDGSIMVNGETVKKITIDGKTFFLDDPSIATSNIPAKIVNKVKVVQRKSEQAEFTGIDDGERETVIDLSVKGDVLNGAFGNLSAGLGRDFLPDASSDDTRYQGAAFVGKFTKKTQLSFLFNANNTNNRGFGDVARSEMGGLMRKAGSSIGEGITSSFSTGANAVSDFFDGKMTLGGNYLFGRSDADVIKSNYTTTYLQDKSGRDYNRITDEDNVSHEIDYNHKFGLRLEHKFSKKATLIFEPSISYRDNRFTESGMETISKDNLDGRALEGISEASTFGEGRGKTINTGGFLLFNRKLGLPGRTLSVTSRYSVSHYNLTGVSRSNTYHFDSGIEDPVDQRYDYITKSDNFNFRVNYIEPMGHNIYLSGYIACHWDISSTDKEMFDFDVASGRYATEYNVDYSSHGTNVTQTQTMGANFLYQTKVMRLQAGFSAIPTRIRNKTDRYDYDSGVIWNWSPQVSGQWEANENTSLRWGYMGKTANPTPVQLHSVADKKNPMNVTFGNPYLIPYFSHNITGDIKYNKRSKFFTINGNVNAGMVRNPIVNAIWYGSNGAQYSMPFNGPTSASAGMSAFTNAVIGGSSFSVSGMVGLRWKESGYYVGNDVDMSVYESEGYYAFMDRFLGENGRDLDNDDSFVTNVTNTLTPNFRVSMKYSKGNAELRVNGGSSMNKSWYRLGEDLADNTMTLNNHLGTDFLWKVSAAGLNFKTSFTYRWYEGYSGSMYEPEALLNAEVQKLLFKKKCTLALKGFDLLGQAKTLSVTDESNYHEESYVNTLGRYAILSFAYRFGNSSKGPKKPV